MYGQEPEVVNGRLIKNEDGGLRNDSTRRGVSWSSQGISRNRPDEEGFRGQSVFSVIRLGNKNAKRFGVGFYQSGTSLGVSKWWASLVKSCWHSKATSTSSGTRGGREPKYLPVVYPRRKAEAMGGLCAPWLMVKGLNSSRFLLGENRRTLRWRKATSSQD